MPKKKQSVKGKILRKKTFFSLKGGSSIAMFVVIGLVVLFAGFMVMGANNLSAPDDSTGTTTIDDGTSSSGGSCCDSGDGENCKPLTSEGKVIRWKGKEYGLLKSNVLLNEGNMHLSVILNRSEVEANPPLADGQWFVLNDSNNNIADAEEEPGDNPKFNCTGGYRRLDQMGWSEDSCFPVPDDQLIFKCIDKCNVGAPAWAVASGAVFDVYFRLADMQPGANPDLPTYNAGGIPTEIKNCSTATQTTPGAVITQTTKQEVIVENTNSGDKNLQLKTFTVKNQVQVQRTTQVAAWISPWCKPAIYVYPKEKTYVNVKVATEYPFLFTIPRYPESGWNVLAYPDGSLFYDNKPYDYLYYETEVSDTNLRLPQEGYVVKKAELQTFLPQLVLQLGLNQKETKQFTEYWTGVLPDAPFYKIKIVPQTNLDELAQLKIVPPPDQIVRVALHFEAIDNYEDMTAPQLQSVERNGFVVSEWGGIFKKGRYTFSCLM